MISSIIEQKKDKWPKYEVSLIFLGTLIYSFMFYHDRYFSILVQCIRHVVLQQENIVKVVFLNVYAQISFHSIHPFPVLTFNLATNTKYGHDSLNVNAGISSHSFFLIFFDQSCFVLFLY